MTKKELKNKCRTILNKYNFKELLNSEDYEFMTSVFKNHPDWESKRKEGVKAIEVNRSIFGNKCFYIIRFDDTKIDISFHSAIDGDATLKSKVSSALRTAIRNEILDFKRKNVEYGVTRCVVSGEVLTKGNTNIDHYDLTFAEMCKLWNKELTIDDIVSCDQHYEIKDDDLKQEFIDFHNKHCKLRAVTDKVNQSL